MFTRKPALQSLLLIFISITLASAITISAQAQNLIWAKRAGGTLRDWGHDIAVLSDGSALVTGEFRDTATFGPGESGETTLASGGMFIAKYHPTGPLAWAKAARRAAGNGIAVLSDGSALVTGKFYGTATFGPGESGETTLTSAGGDDMFVAKYHPDGTLAWGKRAGGNQDDQGSGIAVLPDGSSLVTGWFQDTATFGPGESGETTLAAGLSRHMFVARYNPDGTLAWAKNAGGKVEGYDIAVHSDGSAVVTGGFSGTPTFGPGESGETTLSSTLYYYDDIFVAGYNPDGTLAWVKQVGALYYDLGGGVAVLSDGSALVTGYFSGVATFGKGESGSVTLDCGFGDDVFIARYNPDGTLTWAKQAGGDDFAIGNGIAVLPDGSALVTGSFQISATFGAGESEETILFSAGQYDIFVARYNPDGTLAWVKRAGGTEYESGSGIAVLADGSGVLVTGGFADTATFGSGESGWTPLASAGDYDVFIAKFVGAVSTHAHPYWSLYY